MTENASAPLEDEVLKEMEETDWSEDPLVEEVGDDEHLDTSGEPEGEFSDEIPDDFDIDDLECVDEDVEDEKPDEKPIEEKGSRSEERKERKEDGKRVLAERSSRHCSHRHERDRDSGRGRNNNDRLQRVRSPLRKSSTASPRRRERDRRRKKEWLLKKNALRQKKNEEEVCIDDLEEVDCYDDESDATSLAASEGNTSMAKGLDTWNDCSFDDGFEDDCFPSLEEGIDIEAVTRASRLPTTEGTRLEPEKERPKSSRDGEEPAERRRSSRDRERRVDRGSSHEGERRRSSEHHRREVSPSRHGGSGKSGVAEVVPTRLVEGRKRRSDERMDRSHRPPGEKRTDRDRRPTLRDRKPTDRVDRDRRPIDRHLRSAEADRAESHRKPTHRSERIERDRPVTDRGERDRKPTDRVERRSAEADRSVRDRRPTASDRLAAGKDQRPAETDGHPSDSKRPRRSTSTERKAVPCEPRKTASPPVVKSPKAITATVTSPKKDDHVVPVQEPKKEVLVESKKIVAAPSLSQPSTSQPEPKKRERITFESTPSAAPPSSTGRAAGKLPTTSRSQPPTREELRKFVVRLDMGSLPLDSKKIFKERIPPPHPRSSNFHRFGRKLLPTKAARL